VPSDDDDDDDVYTGLMNLMGKCVQIKDELGQLYTYLLNY
jgi:hypothetical protein